MAAKFICAILIHTENLQLMGSFYRDVLGLPLEEDLHGELPTQYGCELGEIHFAIHPVRDGQKPGVGAVKLAFEVFDLDQHMRQMVEHNVNIIAQAQDLGSMKMAAIKDPDGNTIEFTELSKNWIEHLRSRRAEGQDLVSEWDKRRS